MSAQDLQLRLDGIKSFPSPLTAPQGALEEASNVVITRNDTIEIRRGFKRYNDIKTDINNVFEYKDTLYLANNDILSQDTNPTWTDFVGSLKAPNNFRIRSAQQNQNFYLTSDEGIKKIDLTNTQLTKAGVPTGLPLEGLLSSNASGPIPVDCQVAYRVVWTIEDENKNLIVGAPSSRLVIINLAAGAVSDTDLTIKIPNGITTDHKYQIYRSAASISDAVIPNDELQLVHEAAPTSPEVSAGTLAYTDTTQENNRGAFLYTSPSQDGISKSNNIPPLSQDITTYKNTVLYANTKYFQTINLVLQAAGAPDLQTGDTITIDGVGFTGVGAGPTNNQFVVDTSGTDAENAANTAYNLCLAVNKSTTLTTIEGHYTGDPSISPGALSLMRVSLDGSSFTVTASSSTAGNSFRPNLPTSGSDVESTDNQQKHRIYVSKRNQPEGVPILNYFNVGSAEHEIERIISISDSVFIFKKDGIFRLTGEIFENFRIFLYDDTNKLVSRDSAINYNDAVFCFTNQGIMAISPSSPQIVSKDIQEEIMEKVNFTNVGEQTFSIAYETDRKFIMFTVKEQADITPNIAYVYDSITRAWTTWDLENAAGFTNSTDDKLYLCGTDGYLRQERKDFSETDYSDDEFDVTITGTDGEYIVTLSDVTNVDVGQSLYQTGRKGQITAINGLDLTLDSISSWANGAATVHDSILTRIKWLPQFATNPGVVKRWKETTVMMRDMRLRPITLGFTSNFSDFEETIELSASNGFPWGSGTWGGFPWGGGAVGQQNLRTLFPREKHMAIYAGISISTNEAFVRFATNGVSIIYEIMDTRIK